MRAYFKNTVYWAKVSFNKSAMGEHAHELNVQVGLPPEAEAMIDRNVGVMVKRNYERMTISLFPVPSSHVHKSHAKKINFAWKGPRPPVTQPTQVPCLIYEDFDMIEIDVSPFFLATPAGEQPQGLRVEKNCIHLGAEDMAAFQAAADRLAPADDATAPVVAQEESTHGDAANGVAAPLDQPATLPTEGVATPLEAEDGAAHGDASNDAANGSAAFLEAEVLPLHGDASNGAAAPLVEAPGGSLVNELSVGAAAQSNDPATEMQAEVVSLPAKPFDDGDQKSVSGDPATEIAILADEFMQKLAEEGPAMTDEEAPTS